MSGVPGVTPELVLKLEDADSAYTRSRMAGIQAQVGNPWGIHFLETVRGRTFVAQKIPTPQFNRVVQLGEREDVLAALAFFEAHGVSARAEILPGQLAFKGAATLHEHNLLHTGFKTVVFGPAQPLASPGDIAVQRVESSADFRAFLDINLEGFNVPRSIWEPARLNMAFWLEEPNWYLFLARIDGEPASAGTLFVHDDVGYLAAAATRVDYRGRGGHRAVLRHRIAEASQLGCDLVTSQTEFGSISQRNMQRLGLQVACNKAVWTQLAGG